MGKMRYNKSGGSMKKVCVQNKNIFFLILFVIFTFLLFFFLSSFISYQNKKNDMAKLLLDLSLMEATSHKKNDLESTYVHPSENLKDPYYTYILKDFLEADMGAFLSKNKDTKGYIQIEGTSFSYPFVSFQKGFYKTHSYYQKENDVGWLYMDEKSNLDTFSSLVLYADGKKGDSVFSLKEVLQKKFLKENNLVKLSTEKTNSLWKPFSVYIAKEPSSFKENPYTLLLRSSFPFSVDVDEKDTVLTIVTRFSKNKVLVFHAKLVKKMERE